MEEQGRVRSLSLLLRRRLVGVFFLDCSLLLRRQGKHAGEEVDEGLGGVPGGAGEVGLLLSFFLSRKVDEHADAISLFSSLSSLSLFRAPFSPFLDCVMECRSLLGKEITRREGRERLHSFD